MACVDVPALPLQLVLRRHPDWRGHPVVVVDCDKPQGRVLYVNRKAQASRILPGMRYGAALSLCGALRAAEVPPSEVERAVKGILSCLQGFTPGVEACDAHETGLEPGVFWLNASGLSLLYKSLLEWGGRVREALQRDEHLKSTVIVGFSKFGTYAVARTARGVLVFQEHGEERDAACRVPMERLSIPHAVRDTLCKLGVHTVGDFVKLPAEGIEKRFGRETWHLHRLSSGELEVPFAANAHEEIHRQEMHLDHAETDTFRLVALVGRMLQPLLEGLAHNDEAISEVRVDFDLERGGKCHESLRPAAPTLDWRQLTDLVRLRLEAARLGSRPAAVGGITSVVVTVKGARVKREQLELFAEIPPRNWGAANRALARLRAEFGEAAVVCARLREGHLPEARFVWERLGEIRKAEPRNVESSVLVRRIYTPKLFLPARPRQEPDGWMLRGLEHGPVVRVRGPYVISGGWWHRNVHREYHFAETQKGELLWVYYDRPRRRWCLQGRVE